MTSSSPLANLVTLAGETSSPKRRELLRRVTDLFLSRDEVTLEEAKAFDRVLVPLAEAVEQDVLRDLAQRFGEAGKAPLALATRLARDCIEVAMPILSNKRLLGETELIEIAQSQGQAHLCAIATRAEVSPAVSAAIVRHADDSTLAVLIRNEGAVFSRETSEEVADRAAKNSDLHDVVIGRSAMPLDLVNSLYLVVERHLRERIRARNAAADPDVLEAAFAAVRERMSRQLAKVEPIELEAARLEVGKVARHRRLTPRLLLEYLRSGQSAHFSVGLAMLAEVQDEMVVLLLGRRDLDGLAVLCRAVDMERAIFLSLSLHLLQGREVISQAQGYADLFEQVPREVAQRTLRFWRVRAAEVEHVAA